MGRRFAGFRQRLVATGRKTFWLGGAITESTLGSGNSALMITSLNAAALALRPFTVVRTRGYWAVHSDQAIANENQIVHLGSIVVSDQAVAVGITAVPTPVTEDGSSWILFDGTAQSYEFLSSTGARGNHNQERYVIDSKSMRKVEEGQDLIKVIQNGATGDGAVVVVYTKVLIKLH